MEEFLKRLALEKDERDGKIGKKILRIVLLRISSIYCRFIAKIKVRRKR